MNICRCAFCTEYSGKEKSSRVIWEDENYALFPTVGCFVEGYCLFIPKKHITSFASLETSELIKVRKIIRYFKKIIQVNYPGQLIIAEHGSNGIDCGASCIDHAHVHLIPIKDPIEIFSTYLTLGGNPIFFENYELIGKYKEVPYVYLSWLENKHLIWTNVKNLPKQLIRIACASYLGMEEYYNWRIYSFEEQMKNTVQKLRPNMNGDVIV